MLGCKLSRLFGLIAMEGGRTGEGSRRWCQCSLSCSSKQYQCFTKFLVSPMPMTKIALRVCEIVLLCQCYHDTKPKCLNQCSCVNQWFSVNACVACQTVHLFVFYQDTAMKIVNALHVARRREVLLPRKQDDLTCGAKFLC